MVVKERMHFQRKTCFSCGHIKQLSQFCDAKLALREERMMRVLMIRKTLWGKENVARIVIALGIERCQRRQVDLRGDCKSGSAEREGHNRNM